jgi:predicted nucleic acid-binding protein
MILLDTNVLSEPMRASPDAAVTQWLDMQPMETLYVSVVTLAEMRAGIARLPAGKRRNWLHEQLENKLLPPFAGRILPLDAPATEHYAELMGKAEHKGMKIHLADGYIAAIAAARKFAVATRDVTPFLAASLTGINPWKA